MNQILHSQVIVKAPARLALTPRKAFIVLFGIAVTLFALNVTGLYMETRATGNQFVANALLYFFDASLEGNIPTLFSVLILFVCSMLLLLLFLTDQSLLRTNRKYWLSLSLIFLFLTIDEAVRIHEQFNKLQTVIGSDGGGYLKYPWILPYAFMAALACVFFLGFLRTLPDRTRKLFFFAGMIYVTAALGFEVFEGRMAKLYGTGHIYDKLLCAIEEFLEMGGIIIFLYALLDYLRFSQRKVTIYYKTE